MSERTVSVRITGNAADFQAALEAAGVQAKVVADQIVDAFGTTFKAKLDAAFKSLPDLKINADSSDVDTKLAAIKGEMDDLRNKTIGVDLSDTEALAKIDDLRARLVVVAAESPDIRIKVDAADAIAKLEAVKKAADDASGDDDKSGLKKLIDNLGSGNDAFEKFASGAGEALGPLGSLVTPMAALAPALVPLGAAAAAAGIGLTGMALSGGAAIGAFGLAALPVFSKVSTAITTITADQSAMNGALTASQKTDAYLKMQQDLSNLSPMVRQVADAVINAKQAFNDWDAQFDPAILQVFNSALADFKPLLNDITPLVTAGAQAINGFFKSVGNVANSGAFQHFIMFLGSEAGPAISTITTAMENFGKGIASALEASPNLISGVEKGIVSLSKGFASFTKSKDFTDFLDWIQKNGPAIVSDVKKIGTAVGHLVTVFAPLGMVVLNYGADIAQAIGKLGTLVDSLAAFFSKTLPHAISVMSGAFTSGFQAVHNIVNTVWHAIENDFIHPLVNFFTNSIPNAIGDMVGFFTAIPGEINHVWSDVVNALHSAWSDVANWVHSNLVQPVVNFFTSIPGDVNHVWSDVVSALHSAWSDVANWVNSTFAQPIVSFFSGIPGTVDHVWTDITSAIHSAWQDIASWVGNNVVEPVLHLFGTIIDGAADAFSWVPVVGGKLSAAKQAFDNFAAGVQQDLNSLHPPPPISISIDTSQAMSAIVSLGQAAATAAAQTQSAGVGFASLNLPHFAAGGIVTQRTLAIVGEAGPEMIIPLSNLATAAASTQGLSSIGAGPMISSGSSTDTSSNSGTSSLVVELDGNQIGHLLLPFLLPAAYQKRRSTGTLQLS